MSLITQAEVKTILQISTGDTTYDDQITDMIDYAQEDIIDYCENMFWDSYVYRADANALEFVRDTSTADYITDEDEEFEEKGFLDGMDIAVNGGGANVGVYNVTSASTNQLTLSAVGELINQDQNDTKEDHTIGTIRISRVNWPKALKLPAAKMVWHLIDQPTPDNVKSERLDDYSITYVGQHAYPKAIVKSLEKYRRPSFA